MDWRAAMYILGRLSSFLGGVMLIPAAVSLLMVEAAWRALLLSAVVPLSLGWLLTVRGNPRGSLTVREGIAITVLGWLLASFFGMLPYASYGLLSPLDGMVESISGFSGTGATVIDSLETTPQGLLLWRALTHWLGGLGIIVIFIALLPQFGHGAIYMFEAESTGPESARFLPRVKAMAGSLFRVYLAFTASCAAVFALAGMTPLDSVNHAMATIATGGFSTKDTSIAFFDSFWIEAASIFFMLISSANFALYVVALRHGLGVILRNTEYRVYLALVFLVSLMVATDLSAKTGASMAESLRVSLFQAASVSSTTGFVSADFDTWPSFSKMCLVFLMMTGGCAGSTAGGLKVSRLILAVRSALLLIKLRLSPRARMMVMLGGRRMDESVLMGALYFFFAYVMIVSVWSLLFILDGAAPFDAVTLAITTMSNVGPAFGKWGATSTYGTLPDFSKCVVCLSMLTGRLEIFTALAICRPSFWKSGKGW